MNRPIRPSELDGAEEIWGAQAVSSNALTFWPRSLLQVTLPHSNPGNVPAWGKRSGDFYLVVEPGHYLNSSGVPVSFGYPYGSLPRLILSYLNREVKRHGSRQINLGNNLSQFMDELGLGPYRSGGRNGNITRIRTQIKALFNANIAFGCENSSGERRINTPSVAGEYELWWDVKNIEQASLYPNWVQLNDVLFEEMQRNAIPLDMRALKLLKRSPLALDLYAWATYRNHARKGRLAVSWKALANQFGAEYSDPKNFARAAKQAFAHICAVYPDLNIDFERGRIILGESNTHIIGLSKPK